MRSPIEQAFARLRPSGRCAFIPFVTGGFPDPSTCVDILLALGDSGADIIEVGIPFSDPLADGPTIQWASRKVLDEGMTVSGIFEIVEKAVKGLSAPVVLMTYCNPLLRMGASNFSARAREAGVAGVIIPDLPVDEADEWLCAAERHHLDSIFLASPTTTPERIREIVSRTSGFLYYVSMTGVTGSNLSISENFLKHIHLARSIADVPVAVGFGVSSPEDCHSLAGAADGVIVGTAIIRAIREANRPGEQIAAAARLARSLNQALKNGEGGDSARSAAQSHSPS